MLQKVDPGSRQLEQGTSVLKRRSPSVSRLTNAPETIVRVIPPSKCITNPEKPLAQQAFISLFEDDWKDEEDTHLLSNKVAGNVLNEEGNSHLKDQRKGAIDLFSNPRQGSMAFGNKLNDQIDMKNHTPVTKTNYQLLKMVGNSFERRDLKNVNSSSSTGVLTYGGLRPLKDEARVKFLAGDKVLNQQKLNIHKSTVSPGKVPRMDIFPSSTHIGHVPTNLSTTCTDGRVYSNVSTRHSTGVSARAISAPVEDTQGISIPSWNNRTTATSGCHIVDSTSKLIGKKVAVSPVKRICTIRPYGRIQESGNLTKDQGKTSNAGSAAPNPAVDINATFTLAASNTWPPSTIQAPSSSNVGSVAAVDGSPKTRCTSSGHMDSYSHTYSRIQSLWDNSKFEDDDLVLQPFQSDTSCNNIILGHISEGSMKE